MKQTLPSENNTSTPSVIFTPRELVKKHMYDPDHIVTDDDLRKLIVGEEAEAYIRTKESLFMGVG